MTDRKFDYIQKKTQHVLTDSKGEIIWLIGERTSEKQNYRSHQENIGGHHQMKKKILYITSLVLILLAAASTWSYYCLNPSSDRVNKAKANIKYTVTTN